MVRTTILIVSALRGHLDGNPTMGVLLKEFDTSFIFLVHPVVSTGSMSFSGPLGNFEVTSLLIGLTVTEYLFGEYVLIRYIFAVYIIVSSTTAACATIWVYDYLITLDREVRLVPSFNSGLDTLFFRRDLHTTAEASKYLAIASRIYIVAGLALFRGFQQYRIIDNPLLKTMFHDGLLYYVYTLSTSLDPKSPKRLLTRVRLQL
ncbi:hypothetical protein Clacol_000119 [Clathrus columnatus]|uniref:DUF6533 domain-containing protein n=1 Tax=Clathrus columnatus TaxID=1419009 RepID=A0AAV4ZXV1_9AGAM|nr:hypothetical protein Clacol_000119 [Clathrus columnatus]